MRTFPNWQLHRGYWKSGVRENTLAAFQAAKDSGAEMVELDVQLSRDGTPFVFHDFNLKRTFHIDQSVNKVSADDLSGLGICTLEEVLKSDQVPTYLNIELKSIDLWARRLPLRVGALLEHYEKLEDVIVSSFNPMCLYWLRRKWPELSRGLLVGHPEALYDWKFKHSVRLAQPHFLNAHYKLVDDKDSRDFILSFRRPIMVWTVNDHDKAQLYLKRGAASIISDLPQSDTPQVEPQKG